MNDAAQVVVENEVTWVEIATLGTAIVVAFAAIVGTVSVFVQTQRQIGQAKLQHKEQLASLLRPVVIVRHLECGIERIDSDIRMRISMWLQNVGPGPALQIEFGGWVYVPKANRFLEPEAWRVEVDEAKLRVDRARPPFRVRLGALAPNQVVGPISLVPEFAMDMQDYAQAEGVMLYLATFQDAFGNKRPPVPLAEASLGSESFKRPGTLSF